MTRLLTARRSLAATALAPLLATGLVACGDDGGSDSASEPTSEAAPVADGLEEGDEVDPSEFVQTVTDGLEASTTAHIEMTMSLGSAGEMTSEGDIDYTTDPPEVAMTMDSPLGGEPMDIRMVDGVMYIGMGQMTEGKFWKLDPSDPDSPLAGMGMEGMLDQMDPGKALTTMEEGISTVVYAGEEDGLEHYELTVDLQQAMESMGGAVPPAATKGMPETMTYDLWLDDEGRFTKMSMDDLAMGEALGGQTMSMEMTVSGWGDEVDIEAPADDEVTEMPDLGSMMPGGATGGA